MCFWRLDPTVRFILTQSVCNYKQNFRSPHNDGQPEFWFCASCVVPDDDSEDLTSKGTKRKRDERKSVGMPSPRKRVKTFRKMYIWVTEPIPMEGRGSMVRLYMYMYCRRGQTKVFMIDLHVNKTLFIFCIYMYIFICAYVSK